MSSNVLWFEHEKSVLKKSVWFLGFLYYYIVILIILYKIFIGNCNFFFFFLVRQNKFLDNLYVL